MRILLVVLMPLLSQLSNTVHYNDKGVDFQPWMRTLLTEMGRHWVGVLPSSASRFRGHAAVFFSVSRSGDIVNAEILVPAGLSGLDRLCLDALHSSELDPLPADYPDEIFSMTLVCWKDEKPYSLFEDETLSAVVPVRSKQQQSELDHKLLDAAARGDAESVQQVVGEGASLEARDPYGRTPLIVASAQGHLGLVRALLELGADLNAQTETGHNALAFSQGHQHVTEFLREKGAEWPWDEEPVLIHQPPPPEYPARAREAFSAGKVILRVRVLTNGSTEVMDVIQAAARDLTETAKENAREWRWKPAEKGGEPVEALGIITVTFDISTNR